MIIGLCITSCIMIGVGIHKCIRKEVLGMVNITNGAASLVYWIKPCESHRRCIDVYTARIGAIVYTLQAIKCKCKTVVRVISELIITGVLYQISCVAYPRRVWKYIHIVFHIQTIKCMKLC